MMLKKTWTLILIFVTCFQIDDSFSQENYAIEGLVSGAALGGVLFALHDEYSGSSGCEIFHGEDDPSAKDLLICGGVGVVAGGLVGLFIGAQISKYDIQIAPILIPSKNSLDAGLNVGLKF